MPYKINHTTQVSMHVSRSLPARLSFLGITLFLAIGSCSRNSAGTFDVSPPTFNQDGSTEWPILRALNLPSYFGVGQYLTLYSNNAVYLMGMVSGPENDTSTNLNLSTGTLSWARATNYIPATFDASTQTWTYSAASAEERTWSFSASDKLWLNTLTSEAWTFDTDLHCWKVDGLQDGTYWRWNFSSELWVDTSNGYRWQFSPSTYEWVNVDSAPNTPLNFPPLPLCQQMYTLTIVKAAYGANIFNETNQAVWTLTAGNNDSFTGTNAARDFSFSITPQSQTVTALSGHTEKPGGSLTCTASFTNAAALGSFEWASTGVTAGLTEKWIFNKGTGIWVDEPAGETWLYDQTDNTFTNQANNEEWVANSVAGPLSTSWTKVSDNTTWNFISSQGVWRYTDGSTTWNYRFLFRSTSWLQVSTNGQAPSVSFPPLPIVQLTYISTMNTAYLFRGALDMEWEEVDRSPTQTSFINDTKTATLTASHDHATISYNLAHKGLELSLSGTEMSYANRSDPSNSYTFILNQAWEVRENGSQTPSWSFNSNTSSFSNTDNSITWSSQGERAYQGSTYQGVWSYSPTTGLWTETKHNSTWRYDFYSRSWQKTSQGSVPEQMISSYFPPMFITIFALRDQLRLFLTNYNNLTGLRTTSLPYTNVTNNSVTTPTVLRWTSSGGFFEGELAEYEIQTANGTTSRSLSWGTDAEASFVKNLVSGSYSWDAPYEGGASYNGSIHTWVGEDNETWVYNPSLKKWTNSTTNVEWIYNATTSRWGSAGTTWKWDPAQNTWTDSSNNVWRYNFSTRNWCHVGSIVNASWPTLPLPLIQQQYVTMIFNLFNAEGLFDTDLTVTSEDNAALVLANDSLTASLTYHKDTHAYSWILGKTLETIDGVIGTDGWNLKNYSGELQDYDASPISGGLSFSINDNQPSWNYNTGSSTWTSVGTGATWTLASSNVWSTSVYNGTWTYSPTTRQWTESIQNSRWRYNPATRAWEKVSGAALNPAINAGQLPPPPVHQMAYTTELVLLLRALTPTLSYDLEGDTAKLTALFSLSGTALQRQTTTLKAAILDSLEEIERSLNLDVTQEESDYLLETQTAYESLLSRCNQMLVVATFQASMVTILQNLCTLNPLQLTAAATDTLIQTAYNDFGTLDIAAANDTTVIDQDIEEFFEESRMRSMLVGSTIGALRDFKAIQSTIAATLESLLSLPTHPVTTFESNYATAATTLISQMQGGINQLNSALIPLNNLTQEDTASDDTIDEMATAADRLKIVLTLWSSFLSARISQYTALKSILSGDLARRQLLFNAATFTEKAALKTSIAATLPGHSTQVATLLSGITAAIASLTIPATTFQTLPQTPAGQGQTSNMRVHVNAKVDLFNKQLTLLLQQLSVQIPSQALINQIIAGLAPAVLLHQTANAMSEWLTQRSVILTTSPLPNAYQDLKTGYLIEWNELLAVLTSALTSSSLSSGVKSAITDLRAANNFGLLISATPTAQDFAAQTNRLSKREIGEVDQIVTQVLSEVQRLASSCLVQNQAAVTDISLTPLSITPPTPTLVAVPEQPTQTINNTAVLTTPLSNDSTLVLTGNQAMPSQLRDPILNTSITNKLSANLRLFLNKSARVGLGAANISNKPGQSLNVLGGSSSSGQNSIQLVADGNCFVDVNSDLIIAGSKPIVPSANFGKALHSITFTSPVERTITVLENTIWDLSDFAATGSDYLDYGKKIVFSGKIKLVLETGAKIRFPVIDPARKAHAVIVCFEEEAQLVCQGNMRNVGRTWTSNQSDSQRNKILGMGELWLAGNAQMVVHKPALLSIEADYATPTTNITLQLTDAAQLTVGTDSIAGGAFQIGNMFNGGSKEHPESTSPDSQFPNNTFNTNYNASFTPRKTSIDFTLRLKGPRAQFTLGRQGFLGLAAGVINKDGAETFDVSPPNGSWLLQHLYNVNNITIDITQGRFSHSIIAAGDSSHCSVLAVSPLAGRYPNCRYTLNLAHDGTAQILGGGNLYFVDTNASMQAAGNGTATASPHTLQIADTCGSFNFSAANSGLYATLTPLPSMFLRGDYLTPQASSRLFGRGFITSSTQAPYTFCGPAEEFLSALKMTQYNDITERYVPIALLENNPLITYVNNQTITRTAFNATNLRDGSTADALSSAYVRGEKQNGGIPRRFSLAAD